MAKQTQLGKAFEYACLKSLYQFLISNQSVTIEQSNSLAVAENFYNDVKEEIRRKMDLGANAAARIILRLEPQLENPLTNTPLYLSIQDDSVGIGGDVRDVVCVRKQNEWEIGLSCKHNHSAVKHSRLSPSIDFGLKWFGIECSKEYFSEIDPIFEELKEMKKVKILWRDIENKEERYYKPILKAFIRELRRLDEENPNVIPGKLLEYLLGKNDFYKVIVKDNKKLTQIQAFNLHNTLNRNARDVKPQTRIQKLKMPTRFYDIDFKDGSGNTIHVVCDGGWTIGMRIHNASSKVEPSLKFDVQIKGMPPELYSHYEPWEENN